LERANTKTAEIHRDVVEPERQLDDHPITIPFWDKGDDDAGAPDEIAYG
jgi:hypothetical protein